MTARTKYRLEVALLLAVAVVVTLVGALVVLAGLAAAVRRAIG